MVLKSQRSCMKLDFHKRPWVHLGHLSLVWVVGEFLGWFLNLPLQHYPVLTLIRCKFSLSSENNCIWSEKEKWNSLIGWIKQKDSFQDLELPASHSSGGCWELSLPSTQRGQGTRGAPWSLPNLPKHSEGKCHCARLQSHQCSLLVAAGEGSSSRRVLALLSPSGSICWDISKDIPRMTSPLLTGGSVVSMATLPSPPSPCLHCHLQHKGFTFQFREVWACASQSCHTLIVLSMP